MLCSNRPEGFGPHSALSAPLPTTCFIDTILIPLPVWLALLLLPVIFALSLRHRKTNFNPSTINYRTTQPKRLYVATASLYYVLIICNILMQTLEIVRLELIHFGIGLLPFAYVGLLLGGALHWSTGVQGRLRGWHSINLVLWLGGIAMSVVKVIGLDKQGIDGRKGSKYPVSDQVIDVAVMAGVYAVIAILEVALAFWRALRRVRAIREERGASEASEAAVIEPVQSWSANGGSQGKWN